MILRVLAQARLAGVGRNRRGGGRCRDRRPRARGRRRGGADRSGAALRLRPRAGGPGRARSRRTVRRRGQSAGRHAVRFAGRGHRLPRRSGGRSRLRYRHRHRAGGLAGGPRRPGGGQGGGQPASRRAARPGALFHRSVLYGDGPIWKHVGIYAYRREALERFCTAPPSPLERREKLEQLRALELGLSIWAAVVDETPDFRRYPPPTWRPPAPSRGTIGESTTQDRLPGRARRQQRRGLPHAFPRLRPPRPTPCSRTRSRR